jgi:starvation-inducible DNA-binding protein
MDTSTLFSQSARQQVAQYLSQLLADTYLIYIKTQNFHWNVIDPRFHSLHEMFEEQYQQLAQAVDEIAERIRMLKSKAPGSMRQFLDLTTISESEGDLSADKMIEEILDNHEQIIDSIRPRIEETAALGDEGTTDLLIQRLRYHEKTAWMLRSHFPSHK